MKAAILAAPGRVALRDVGDPVPGVGEVRLRVLTCSTCGSEVDPYAGRAAFPPGKQLGHEFEGVVDRVGPGVETPKVGDRVAGWKGWPLGDPWGFAEYAVVRAQDTVPALPGAGLPVLTEVTGTVANAVTDVGPKDGDHVVVFGASGAAGNLLIQAIRGVSTPASLIAVGRRNEGLERALSAGATHTVNVKRGDSLEALVRQLTPDGADVFWEASGTQDGLDAAKVKRFEAKVALYGYHQGPRTLNIGGDWQWPAARIHNTHYRDPERCLAGMRTAMRWFADGIIDPEVLGIEHFEGLDRVGDAFEAAKVRGVKAVVEIATA